MNVHNPELNPFYKGRESELNRAIIRILAEKPRTNIYKICRFISESEFGPVGYPTVYRRVVDLTNNAFWWLNAEGTERSSRNPILTARPFALSLTGVLACIALWPRDLDVIGSLRKSYPLYFPIYFVNHLDHPLAEEWLLSGIGGGFRSGILSINMSWDFFMVYSFTHLARFRRVMEKRGDHVNGLGISQVLLAKFRDDTASIPESGWDKVTYLLDPKHKTFKSTAAFLEPQRDA